jgi:hypothetical protein
MGAVPGPLAILLMLRGAVTAVPVALVILREQAGQPRSPGILLLTSATIWVYIGLSPNDPCGGNAAELKRFAVTVESGYPVQREVSYVDRRDDS